eukprot:356351-Chlamydomonas_euryale.AAC.5
MPSDHTMASSPEAVAPKAAEAAALQPWRRPRQVSSLPAYPAHTPGTSTLVVEPSGSRVVDAARALHRRVMVWTFGVGAGIRVPGQQTGLAAASRGGCERAGGKVADADADVGEGRPHGQDPRERSARLRPSGRKRTGNDRLPPAARALLGAVRGFDARWYGWAGRAQQLPPQQKQCTGVASQKQRPPARSPPAAVGSHAVRTSPAASVPEAKAATAPSAALSSALRAAALAAAAATETPVTAAEAAATLHGTASGRPKADCSAPAAELGVDSVSTPPVQDGSGSGCDRIPTTSGGDTGERAAGAHAALVLDFIHCALPHFIHCALPHSDAAGRQGSCRGSQGVDGAAMLGELCRDGVLLWCVPFGGEGSALSRPRALAVKQGSSFCGFALRKPPEKAVLCWGWAGGWMDWILGSPRGRGNVQAHLDAPGLCAARVGVAHCECGGGALRVWGWRWR